MSQRHMQVLGPDARLVNRAYSENVNFKGCAPSTLKLNSFCGLLEIKKCWKVELDILNSSGDRAAQKYIEYKETLRMYLVGYR